MKLFHIISFVVYVKTQIEMSKCAPSNSNDTNHYMIQYKMCKILDLLIY